MTEFVTSAKSWEEWHHRRQEEPMSAQEQEHFSQRIQTAEEVHGRWVTIFAMTRHDLLVSYAGWQMGRVTFIKSPMICPINTVLGYQVLGEGHSGWLPHFYG